jgi:hypothetical protein
LAPLIKNDREQRRQMVAFETARRKARKRAVKIVSFALIFSIVVAFVIWFFATKKARADKAVAEKETLVLKKNITADSLKLDSVKQSINKLVVNKDDTNKVPALLKEIIISDSIIKNLNEKVMQLTQAKTASDSANNVMLRNKEISLNNFKHEDSLLAIDHARLNTTYDSLNRTFGLLNKGYTSLKGENTQLSADLGSSKNDYSTLKTNYDNLKSTYDNLKGDYDLLKRNFNELKVSKPPAVTEQQQPSEPADNNGLRLNLYSSKNEKIPENIPIFLIPDIPANRKIIRDAKVYDNHYDLAALNSAQGVKKAVFDNGSYTFSNVDPGDYFVKICFNYGPYKNITKKSTGNETSPKIDISEIIK